MNDDSNRLKNRQQDCDIPFDEVNHPNEIGFNFPEFEFLLCKGLNDTNIHNPRNSYKSVTYKTICEMAKKPTAIKKDDSFATILSTYRNYDGKKHSAQRLHGQFGGIAVDIDVGNLDIETFKNALNEVIGDVDYLIYSTSTALPDDRKWRAFIPLDKLYPYSQIEYIKMALYNSLDRALGGVFCDRKMETPGIVCFLPNVPYEYKKNGITKQYRNENGEPFFYQYYEKSDSPSRLNPLACNLVKEEKNLEKKAIVAAQEEEQRRKENQEKLMARMSTSQTGTPIDLFNKQYSIEELLDKYGYQSLNSRWLSPYQSSGIPGTVLNEDKTVCFIHSQSDIDKGIGRSSAGYPCNYADAFDLYTHYEHQGDARKATRGAANLLGLDRSSPEEDFTEAEELVDEGTGEITKKSLLGEMVDLGEVELTAPDWVIDNLIPAGVGVIAGSPAVGKTTAIIPLALTVAGLSSHLDKHIQSSIKRKLVIFTEDAEQVKRILFGVKNHLKRKDGEAVTSDSIREWVSLYHSKRLSPQILYKRVYEAVEKHSIVHDVLGSIPPLVILDTSSANLDLTDENSNSQVSAHMAKLKELYEQTSAPSFITAHLTKNAKGASIDELTNLSARGGGAWEGDANWTAVVGRSGEDVILKIDKERVGGLRGSEIRFKVTNHEVPVANRLGNMVPVNYPVVSIERLKQNERLKEQLEGVNQELIEYISEQEYPSKQDIIDSVRGNAEKKRDALDFLIKIGRVVELELPKSMQKGRLKCYYSIPMTASAQDDFQK